MITSWLADIAEKLGLTIRLNSGRVVVPDEDYFQQMLDRAALDLYDEPVEARWSGGPLIVEKRADRKEVFIHVGSYK